MAYATTSAHAIDMFMDDIENARTGPAAERLCEAVRKAYGRGQSEYRGAVMGMLQYLHTYNAVPAPNLYTAVCMATRDRIGDSTPTSRNMMALFDSIDTEIKHANLAEAKRAESITERATQPERAIKSINLIAAKHEIKPEVKLVELQVTNPSVAPAEVIASSLGNSGLQTSEREGARASDHLGDTNILRTDLGGEQVLSSAEQVHADTRNLLANLPADVLPSLLAGNMLRLTKSEDIAAGLRIIFQNNKTLCLETQATVMRRMLETPPSPTRTALVNAWAEAIRTLPVC